MASFCFNSLTSKNVLKNKRTILYLLLRSVNWDEKKIIHGILVLVLVSRKKMKINLVLLRQHGMKMPDKAMHDYADDRSMFYFHLFLVMSTYAQKIKIKVKN